MVFLFFILLSFSKIKAVDKTIRLNELYPNPLSGQKEFIEIFNEGSSTIDLSAWLIRDKAGHQITFFAGTIEANQYLAVEKNFSLNNTGDEIYLLNENGAVVSSTSYPGSQKESSWSFNGSTWDWALEATPNKENIFKKIQVYSDEIRLNELLPNPSGDETKNEYIEIYNPTNEDVDLEDWILKDSSASGKYIFPKDSVVEKDDFLVVYRSDFSFAINNSSESVYLFDPNDNLVSSVSFSDSAKEDISYNFDEKNTWRWSKFLTPGKENKFNNLPTYEIKIPDDVYKNVYANFKIKVNDKDKDETKVAWDFGDGHKSYKKETRHKYNKTGKYKASVKIDDGSEKIIDEFEIKVAKFKERKVRLLALSPNPAGKDTDNEWIELVNKDKKKVNLNSWSIAIGKNSKSMVNHPIREDFVLKPGESKILTREICAFTLNNTKSRIELRYPNGEVADKVKYKKDKIEEDEIYFEDNKKWKWRKEAVQIKSSKPIEIEEEIVEPIEEQLDENLLGQFSKDESKKKNQKIYLASNKNISLDLINFPAGRVLGTSISNSPEKFYSFTTKKENKHWIFGIISEINYFLNKILLKLP